MLSWKGHVRIIVFQLLALDMTSQQSYHVPESLNHTLCLRALFKSSLNSGSLGAVNTFMGSCSSAQPSYG